jgi:hypothetical protein
MDIHYTYIQYRFAYFSREQQRWNSWKYNFVEVSERNLESSFSDLRFPFKMFTLLSSFKPLLLKGEGAGVKSVIRGDCE